MNPCQTSFQVRSKSMHDRCFGSVRPVLGLLLLCACPVWGAAQSCLPPASGLGGWWPGDLDGRDVIGSAHGTFQGKAGLRAAPLGFAFNFNGTSDYLDLGRPAALDRSGDLTVEMWVNLDRVSAPGMYLWGDFDPTGNRTQGSFSAASIAGGLGYYHSHTDGTGLSFGYSAPAVLSAGQWHHVAFSRDNSAKTVTIYANGSPYASASYAGKTIIGSAVTGNLAIGRAGSFNGNYVKGAVDEVSAYTRALGPAEIAALALAGTVGKCKPPQQTQCSEPTPGELWLPLDELAGPTARDISGTGHVGTLAGSATFGAGWAGRALDLSSGAGEVVIAPTAGLNYDDWQQQTIEFWVNWSGDRGFPTGNRQYIWEMQDDAFGSTSPFAVVVIDEPDQGSGGGLKAVGRPGVFGEIQAVAPLPVVGRWEHYACVFDKIGQRISVFKNGLLASSVAWVPYGASSNSRPRIGSNNYQYSNSTLDYHFAGLLDEFSIYNTVLSPSTIQAIFISGPLGKCKSPPTADAGIDQAIHGGQTVYLDGSASFDDNTASPSLLYAWELTSRPLGSSAVLAGTDTATPSFFADFTGTYVARLVVTDSVGQSSEPDEVEISSINVAPSAAAGQDQGGVVGFTVALNGEASDDPEDDPLTYAWSFTAQPSGSLANLSGADTMTASFVPDLAGVYLVQLVVHDGFVASAPDEVLVTVVHGIGFAENRTLAALEYVAGLPPSAVTTKGNQKALTNFLSQAIAAMQEGDLEKALDKLNQALGRTDGCVLRSAPDGSGSSRDWITSCNDQWVVYDLLEQAITAISP